MWEPVGPLPAIVYWRRRFVAVAAGVLLILVLAWASLALLAPAPQPVTAAAPAAVTVPEQAPPSPSPPPVTPTVPGEPAVTTSGLPATTSERVLPDETPREPVPVPPSVAVPATGPVPCTNEMLGVTAEVETPEHRVGERPVLRLVIVNLSDQACVRDLDGARQEIVVWSGDGAQRLWSSNDCINPATVDLRTFVPGQPVAFAVRWAGRTSVPGCAEERTVVPPGAYRVMTRVDDLISAPTPFLRNPA